MKAIIVTDKTATVKSRPLPSLRPTYLLVKVNSIALNPTDWKHISRGLAAKPDGSISGCDYAGTVVQVGDGVTKSFNVGDRVCGCAHGCNQSQPDDGVFAEYAVVKGDVQMHIPDSLSFEEAATFPLGVATVAQGLYQKALKLKLPYEGSGDGEWVFIYGGSSATGALGVQFAKASGYKVVTTCSPRNFDFVKGLGVDEVYDYNDEQCGKKINELTQNKLRYVWDTISLESSAKICSAAFSSDSSLGLRYGTILPVKLPQPDERDVETTTTFMYTIFNETFSKGKQETPAVPEDFEFAKKFMNITDRLLKDGKLKTHPEKVGGKGLEGALEGMMDMKNDKVSGQKLVYKVEETEGEGASKDFS